MNNKSVIEVKNLSFNIEKNLILSNVNLAVNQGEVCAIMGKSGAGKSSLLNILATIAKKFDGSVEVNGFDLSTSSRKCINQLRRKEIGVVFQSYNLISTLNVRENIGLSLMIDGENIEKFKHEIESISRELNIYDLLDRFPFEISGGEQQRVAIARALIKKPTILLADEPTGALDSNTTLEFINFLKFANEKYKQTIVIVTHDSNVASQCDKVFLMKEKTIVKELHKKSDLRGFKNEIDDFFLSC